MTLIFAFLVQVFPLQASEGPTPAFDCAKAKSVSEKTICKSSPLSQADQELNQLYESLKTRLNREDNKKLVTEQRKWLKSREACGKKKSAPEIEGCISSQITERKRALEETSTEPESYREIDVFTENNSNMRTVSFNESLKQSKQDGTFAKCSLLVSVHAGTAQGNHSYAGLCDLELNGKTRKVQVCNDDLVGHFKIQDEPPGNTKKPALMDFLINNCIGG